MKKNLKFLLILITLINLIHHATFATYPCEYTCTDNPLEEIYPNQNMCMLLESIPPALQNLSYVMYPCSDIYNTNRFGFNKRFNFFPAAIIVPTTENELIYAFNILKQNHLPFSVRSGGHCFGPGSLSNGYIIDLRNFDTIIPDIQSSTTFIGAGAHLGDVISTLGDLNYAIPTGTCPAVCTGGLALGGGIGYLARPFGLTSDSITSIRLLNAHGIIIDVTPDNYPDLFWALCGAGANAFGIVLGFTFNMYYIPTVSLVSLQWDWNPKLAKKIFNTWQQWITTLPENITTECIFSYRTGTSRVTINALKVGPVPLNEWHCAFEQFNPTITNNYRGNYTGAATKIASTPTPPFSKVKSKFLFEPLPKKGLQIVTDLFSKLQEKGENIRINYFFGSALNGAISQHNPNSSYFPRDAFAWFFQFAYWFHEDQSHETIALLRQLYRDLEPYTSPYSYSNLVDYELGNQYLHDYYGKNVKRLIKTKRKYDPTNIFRWKQGIPLTYPHN
ncbi:MAG TPA: FAD-binding protein [Candidatus Babeliales bacterium]|jgi:FAD/FMN-containing dehydrogenase|nr:FAD-binding protein [Candidatus Babeliales bacterium]